MNKVREAAEFHPSISFTWRLYLAASRRAGLFLAGIGFAAAAAAGSGEVQYAPASPLLPPQQGHASDLIALGPQTVQAVPQSRSAAKTTSGSQTVVPGQTPKGITPEAWSRIMADVQAKTYSVQPSHGATLVAGNPAQHLDARFTARGLLLTPVRHSRPNPHSPLRSSAKMPDAPIKLRTQSINGARNAPVRPVAVANRVEYRHPGYVEWYVNDAKGFEQGWTLNAAASGGKSPSIRIAVSGARTIAEGADAIRIEDHEGKLRYRYAGLKVTDAAQRVLPSHLRLEQPGVIEIAVDDHGAQYPIMVDPALTFTEAVVLSDPGETNGDAMGNAVAVDGDTLVVGAPGTENSQGLAYVFSRNEGGAGAWGLATTLSDPAAGGQDQFGQAVAVNGDTVIVGAYDTGSDGEGAAYIYSRNQNGVGLWGLTATLSPPQAGNDYFGFSVAVDGDTVVVGAFTTNGASTYQGAAYIYNRNQNGAGLWGLSATLNDPAASHEDAFGYAVAVDGQTVVVGAAYAYSDAGTAYVFSLNQGGTGVWGLAATLSNPGGHLFGGAVAVRGDTAVVGASVSGGTFVFSRNQGGTGKWGLVANLNSPAGVDWSVGVDGDFVVVGNYGANNSAGAVYIYNRNQGGAGAWGLVATLNDPAATAGDYFGYAVAIKGGTLIVGAPAPTNLGPGSAPGGQGQTYVYDISGGTFTQAAGIADPGTSSNVGTFGETVAVNGDTLAISAPNSGEVYIFSRNQGGTGLWGLAATLSDPANSDSDSFGASLSANGDTLVVGTCTDLNINKAYVYERNQGGVGTWGLAVTLSAPGSNINYNFGCSVAVDGDTLVVGADGTTSGQGAAYIFSRNQGGAGLWGKVATLTDPASSNDDLFGSAVAVNGDTVVVGAEGGSKNPSKAYIYGRNQGGMGDWGLAVTLDDPGAVDGDAFGSSLAIDGDTLVIGANGFNSNEGSTYIFSRNQGGTGVWGLAASLSDPSATGGDYFGNSVALNGDTIVVGAYETDNFQGAAYLYSRNQGGTGAWGRTTTLSDPATTKYDEFGVSVAIDGETVAAGAYGTSGSQGKTYVYSLVTDLPTVNIMPNSLSFESQGVGTISPAQNVMLSNNGSGSLTITNLDFTGQNTADFSVSSNGCGSAVAPGGNCSVQVVFSPTGTATGSASASLNIASNAPTGSSIVNLTGTVVPATPINFNANGTGTGQVSLTWTASAGANEYYVYYGTSPGGETTQSAAITGTSTNITGLNNGTTYYFVVKAYNSTSGTTSSASKEVSATTALPAPTGLQATAGNAQQANLSWTGVSGASGYYVFYGTTSGNENTQSAIITGTTTTISGLNVGTTYYFVVKAYNMASGVISQASNEASASIPFLAPTNLTATAGAGQVSLSWTASSGASDYYVYYGTASGQESIKSAAITGTSTAITGLSGGTTYYFVVKAYNHANGLTSPASNEASATTVLPAPTGLQAAAGGAGAVTLNWTGVGGASDYYVYYGTTSGKETTKSAAVTGTATTITGLSNITTYYFVVKAYSHVSGITSAASNEASATTELPAPSGLQATLSGTGQVSLSWTGVGGASDYYVYYGTTSGNETTKSAAVTGTATTITGLSNVTTYYFVVKAYSHVSGVTSAASNEVSATTGLPAPTGLQATVSGTGQVALSWTGVGGASDYYVFYGTMSGNETSKSAAVTATSSTITGLSSGTKYYFVVKAYSHSTGLTSAASNEVSATPN